MTTTCTPVNSKLLMHTVTIGNVSTIKCDLQLEKTICISLSAQMDEDTEYTCDIKFNPTHGIATNCVSDQEGVAPEQVTNDGFSGEVHLLASPSDTSGTVVTSTTLLFTDAGEKYYFRVKAPLIKGKPPTYSSYTIIANYAPGWAAIDGIIVWNTEADLETCEIKYNMYRGVCSGGTIMAFSELNIEGIPKDAVLTSMSIESTPVDITNTKDLVIQDLKPSGNNRKQLKAYVSIPTNWFNTTKNYSVSYTSAINPPGGTKTGQIRISTPTDYARLVVITRSSNTPCHPFELSSGGSCIGCIPRGYTDDFTSNQQSTEIQSGTTSGITWTRAGMVDNLGYHCDNVINAARGADGGFIYDDSALSLVSASINKDYHISVSGGGITLTGIIRLSISSSCSGGYPSATWHNLQIVLPNLPNFAYVTIGYAGITIICKLGCSAQVVLSNFLFTYSNGIGWGRLSVSYNVHTEY